MSYVFKPEKSFVAELYWQETGVTVTQENWQASKAQVHRIGVGVNGNVPWGEAGWLFAGFDDYSMPERGYIHGKLVFKNRFWFGCYEDEGTFAYEVRATQDDRHREKWAFVGRRLDMSRNGYFGLYGVSEQIGLDPIQHGTPIWGLEDFSPHALIEGAYYSDIVLLSPQGWPVLRLYEDGYPYLNQKRGEAGLLMLKVVEVNATRAQ